MTWCVRSIAAFAFRSIAAYVGSGFGRPVLAHFAYMLPAQAASSCARCLYYSFSAAIRAERVVMHSVKWRRMHSAVTSLSVIWRATLPPSAGPSTPAPPSPADSPVLRRSASTVSGVVT